MINDIRQMKKRIERAQKEKLIEQERSKKEAKNKVYDNARRTINEIKRKELGRKTQWIKIEKTFLYLKFVAVFAIFAIFTFFLNSAFKDKSKQTNVKILNEENEANELDTKIAEKYIRSILNDVELEGTNSLSRYWSANTDEEARFYGEELLLGIDKVSLEICCVKELPNSQFKVECRRNSHPLSLRFAKNNGKMLLISVN